VFKAGKNRDGYFDNDDLVKQVELSMDIFEEKTDGFKRALFLFDNAAYASRFIYTYWQLPVDPHASTVVVTSATISSYIGYCLAWLLRGMDAGVGLFGLLIPNMAGDDE
jgi:hypothetical protein